MGVTKLNEDEDQQEEGKYQHQFKIKDLTSY